MHDRCCSRRDFLRSASVIGAGLCLPAAALAEIEFKFSRIPVSGELIPAIGMGTWITFDVGNAVHALQERRRVLQAFFRMGGQLVDSSPMYGSAQQVLGRCLDGLDRPETLFSATKIWVPGRQAGIRQADQSALLWGVDHFDLLMVHNMVDWESHLETLQDWKERGRVRYHGITTSHGRRHAEMESVIREQPFDFVQFSYNMLDREAERRLLPAAQQHGKAVIINRPFKTGALFRQVRGKPLPGWAAELGISNWAQYFLKFVISHPAVSCAIPATSRVDHMLENMQALTGPLPDAGTRREMLEYFDRVRV